MQRLFYMLSFILISSKALANTGIVPPITFSKAENINKYTTRIPFKLVDHLMVVEAELLNKKGNFIIDTGSESFILNKTHFQNVYAFNKKEGNTTGVLHNIENLHQKHIKKIALQGFTLENKTSDVIDLSHIENTKKLKILGIIGYHILKDYEVFIDMYLNQITLTKTDHVGNKLTPHVYLEKITDSLNFTLKKHTIVVNGFINNHFVKLGIDSAAEFNQINKRINEKALKYFIPKKRLILTGASKHKRIEVLAGKLHRVKLSKRIYFGPMLTVLTNLSNMNEAFGTDLDGILGYEFFAQKRTIINYKKETLYFIDFPLPTH
ncbi:hypothetical protein FUA26_01055 [Seonamhaeicola algicola]|uniref:Aspartyl protease n=2 Tax=Seonamhaeicola algicola TaxID=1719036 RepID=A0A5C7B1V8_9FLAO|nr:hypothetical protein FUA26_01055 [Seonamhaeicola algicola]